MYKGSTYKPNFKKPLFRRDFSKPRPRFERRDDQYNKYRKNYDIKAAEVRLVDSDGTNRGVVDIRTAISLSQEQGLDLVEVAPQANPPVCRIILWSKFVYEQKKKEKEARKHKQKELKEFRFGTFIAMGDRDRQLARAREFLNKGHNVKLTVTRKGRTPIEQSKVLLEALLTQLSAYSTIERNPLIEGRQISIMIKGLSGGSSVKVNKQVNSQQSDAKAKNAQNSSETVQPVETEGR